MLIPANVTQGATTLFISSSSSILVNRAEQCDTIGHCRTVWNIIWSCLITIFACIWVAVHPNIPQPKPPFRPARFEGPLPRKASWAWVRLQAWALRRYMSGLFRRQLPDMFTALGEKLGIALLALLAPEFIFVWALRQWLRARSIAKECRQAATTDRARARERDWRKQRRAAEEGFIMPQLRAELEDLEKMGYSGRTAQQDSWLENLHRRTQEIGKEDSEPPTDVQDDDLTDWTTTHGFFILMGGFHQFDGDKPLVCLTPDDVIKLVGFGMLIPPSEDEIKDRSKADSFSKLIVLVQTLWFVMQSIARHIQHLPITELEVATLAYTVPILGIYICWWNKPLGVTQPIKIPKSVWNNTEDKAVSLWSSFVQSLTGVERLRNLNLPRVPRFSAGRPSWIQIDQADIATSIITILFGAVHCFAWTFHFPTETERLLWRIASIITTASPIVWAIVYALSLQDDLHGGYASCIEVATINNRSAIVVPLYLIARAILLVVAFISLRSLPRAAYETVYWTTFIPHV